MPDALVAERPSSHGLGRHAARRHRRVLAASVVTLFTTAVLLGLIVFTRWRGAQAVQSDTRSVAAQTAQQLLRTLQSRRGTLTFLRDTLDRRPSMGLPQLQAMGASAVDHTRHLFAVGMIRHEQPPVWWARPQGLDRLQERQLRRDLLARMQLRGVWRVPSTFISSAEDGRLLLVMLEPLRSPAYSKSAVAGVFDLKPLLDDFFTAQLAERYPVRLLDGEVPLYRSPRWPEDADRRLPVERTRLALDAARWTLEMQPGRLRVVQTLSWFTLLLVGLSLIAGLGVTAIVWILAIRNWVLQRAVERRTAALRRASQRLRRMATTDELTGLYNRRYFLNRWEWEFERAKRYQRPLACLMVDVNGFKEVNDRLGHAAGDVLLRRVAEELKARLRQSDILARFGGDEFAVALPETSVEQADAVAEKLRTVRVQAAGARHVPPVTISVGMSRLGRRDQTSQELLEAADESLYADKRRVKAHAPT